jgi:hypothetical protein
MVKEGVKSLAMMGTQGFGGSLLFQAQNMHL